MYLHASERASDVRIKIMHVHDTANTYINALFLLVVLAVFLIPMRYLYVWRVRCTHVPEGETLAGHIAVYNQPPTYNASRGIGAVSIHCNQPQPANACKPFQGGLNASTTAPQNWDGLQETKHDIHHMGVYCGAGWPLTVTGNPKTCLASDQLDIKDFFKNL